MAMAIVAADAAVAGDVANQFISHQEPNVGDKSRG
jgi:hypothetical protein